MHQKDREDYSASPSEKLIISVFKRQTTILLQVAWTSSKKKPNHEKGRIQVKFLHLPQNKKLRKIPQDKDTMEENGKDTL